MTRWQKTKRRKSDKDRQRGQQFMFPLHTDHLAPWEQDDLEHQENPLPPPPKSSCPMNWPPGPPPQDEIPF